jgi:aspartate carbamoyltransferase regulatory subunit
MCITNSEEYIRPTIDIVDKEKITLQCKYCARTITIDELVEGNTITVQRPTSI